MGLGPLDCDRCRPAPVLAARRGQNRREPARGVAGHPHRCGSRAVAGLGTIDRDRRLVARPLNIIQLLAPLAAFLDSAAITLGALRLSVLTVIKTVLALAVM